MKLLLFVSAPVVFGTSAAVFFKNNQSQPNNEKNFVPEPSAALVFESENFGLEREDPQEWESLIFTSDEEPISLQFVSDEIPKDWGPEHLVGSDSSARLLPADFSPRVWIPYAGGRYNLPRFATRYAFAMWANRVYGVDPGLAPFVLATMSTESGPAFRYIATGGRQNFGNVQPRHVSKSGQTQALKKIAGEGWLNGGWSELLYYAGQITDKKYTHWSQTPCSNECAIGPCQFLPTTWVWTINRLANLWRGREAQVLARLKELGLVRGSVQSARQLNPFVYPEAMLGANRYMQECGIRSNGDRFRSWNNSSSQSRTAVKRYNVIIPQFEKLKNTFFGG